MQELALLMVTDCADAQEPEFARLVRQAKAGDAAAFEAILCQFERSVLLTAMRLLNGNLEDAKDAAQQVFLRLHRSLHQLDANRHFASWLYRITVNVCRDMLRVRPPPGGSDRRGCSLRHGRRNRRRHAARRSDEPDLCGARDALRA